MTCAPVELLGIPMEDDLEEEPMNSEQTSHFGFAEVRREKLDFFSLEPENLNLLSPRDLLPKLANHKEIADIFPIE